MDAIESFFSVLSGDTGSIWLRILYYLCIAAVVAVLIIILVIISKFKKRRKRLEATDMETEGSMKGKKRVYEWKDRRRLGFFGLPWTFDRFRLTKEKLLIITGFFNIKEEEIRLYRIVDLELTKSFGQRIFRMGTLIIKSSDKTLPQAILKNIKRPNDVKELISDLVEKERIAKRVSSNEMMGIHGPGVDMDGDGIPDAPEVDINAHL